MEKKFFSKIPLLIGSGVVGIAGLGAWAFEATASQSSSALSTAVPWGSLMALFIVFIGLATGSLLVAAAAELFEWEDLKPASRIAASGGLAASIAGVFYIMADLGTFANITNMLTGFNMRSFLSWDMVALPLFMIASALFLLLKMMGRNLKGAAIFAILASVFLLCIDAWIFSSMTSRESWNSALMLPWFMISAVSSGLALTVLLSSLMKVDLSKSKPVCYGVACLATADVFLAVTELVTGLYHAAGTDYAIAVDLLSGSLAPYFWTEIVCSLAAIALAIACSREKKGARWMLDVAAALVIAGICAKRLYFIASGFAISLMPYPTTEGMMDYASANAAGGFSLPETIMAIGGFGLLIALFLIAISVSKKIER